MNKGNTLHPLAMKTFALGAALALLGVVALWNVGAIATSPEPADKMAVAGSGVEVSAPGEVVTLLTGTLRSSETIDAVVTVSLECSILTEVTTVGNDDQEAFGQVEVWVEMDGVTIPVSEDDTDDTGRVVFCNRAHRQTTSLFDDEDATITSYLKTRSANSFQWITLDLPHGEHAFEVKAELTETASNNGVAEAVVGKRTLTVDPVHLSVDATV